MLRRVSILVTSFWQNKRVLVTGGAGFIGSHVVELLVAEGADVTVPVRTEGRDGFLESVRSQIKVKAADLMVERDCRAVTEGQDVVMNLAADVGGIEYNVAHPASIFRNNLQAYMNCIEAARCEGVERFLVTSSACVYPRHCSIPTPEDEGFSDRPEPTNEGYGWSKRMEEYLGQAYAAEYGMKVGIARPYNCYGPRDNFDPEKSHVIPALVRRIIEGENPLVVWGDGRQSRSFLYVTDFARGLIEMAERYAEADPVNIGAEEETTVKELVELLVDLSGMDIDIQYDTSKPAGQPRRKCDSRKAVEKVGFAPRVALREGLAETLDYYFRIHAA
ncbi:TPA: GDP-fucose synthetase [Candidatus Latescibacteria bacterium]|nr:GDP-fucose synthetase [Candidatus Latescibacterota bacterium]